MVDKFSMEAEISADSSKFEKSVDRASDSADRLAESSKKAATEVDDLSTSMGGTIPPAEKSSGAIKRVSDNTQGMAATRYALYDVATTWGIISAATLGAATAVETVGAGYEYAFSSVRRVTQTAGEEAATLNKDLKGLASTIHEEFASISQVATLGGQMGVATEEIKEFTRNVTMFGATTDATVQQAAVGFGRIAQLTKAGSDSWESIGSAIYQVGITSVATETQIMNVAQEIATAGNLAGFSTDQVIGLAGALASLGIQPERARGNILRIFSEIDKSIAEGGESLEKFAQVSGMTAQEFAQGWKNAPETAFRSLLEGLNNAQEAGANLGQEIRNLGIVAVRDVQTVQQLANNMDVYAKSMTEANNAYRDGTALLEAYGIRSDTVTGKLQILNNVVKNIMDSMSNTTAIKAFLDGFISIGRMVEKIVDTPIGGFFASWGVAMLGLVGIFAAVQGGMAAMRASSLALQLAMINMESRGVKNLDLSLRGLIRSLKEFAVSSNTAAASSDRSAAAATRQATAFGRVGATVGKAATAARLFIGSLGGTVVFAAVSAAIWGVSKAVEHFSGQADRAKTAAIEMFGSFSGLGDAVRADTEAYEESGKYMRLLGVNTEDNSIIWDSATLSQEQLAKAIRNTNDATNEQIVAMGEAADAAIMQSVLSAEGFDEKWEAIKKSAEVAGIGLETIMDNLRTGDTGFLDGLLQSTQKEADDLVSLVTRLNSEMQELELQRSLAAGGPDSRVQEVEELIAAKEREISVAERSQAAATAEADAVSQLHLALTGYKDITEDIFVSAANASEFTELWTGAAEDGTAAIDSMTQSLSEFLDELGSAHEAEDKMESLVNTLLENGTAIDSMTAEGRASFMALSDTIEYFSKKADGDTWAFANSLVDSWAYAEGAGINLGGEVDFLHQTLAGLFTQEWNLALDTTFARDSISAFMDSAIAAIKLRAELERQQVNAHFQASGGGGTGAFAEYNRQMAEISRIESQQLAQAESLKTSLSEVSKRGAQAADNFYNPPGRKSGGGGKKSPIGKDAKEAAEEVRTLTDYVKDLASVSKSAFDFRFGVIIATDQLEAAKRSLQGLKDDAVKRLADAFDGLADSRQKVTDLRLSIQELGATITGLEADKSKLEYFYSVAIEYQDTARAEQILAQLAKVNSDLSKAENDRAKGGADLAKAQQNVANASKEVSDAQRDSVRTLDGNTESVSGQRRAVLDLVSAYQDQITELANSGLSQEQLQRKVEDLRKEFEKELSQLGYNRAEVKRYSDSFKDLSTVIKNIPAYNFKVDPDPALRAIDEFNRKMDAKMKAATGKSYAGPKVGAPSVAGPSAAAKNNAVASAAVAYMASQMFRSALADAIRWSRGTQSPGQISANLIRSFKSSAASALFNKGGYVGAGGQYTPMGIVEGGEYVFPKKDVNQNTGLPHADVLARMMVGSRDMGRMLAGVGGGGVDGPIYISGMAPGVVQALSQALQNQFVIGDKVIAGANNRASTTSTVFGNN